MREVCLNCCKNNNDGIPVKKHIFSIFSNKMKENR